MTSVPFSFLNVYNFYAYTSLFCGKQSNSARRYNSSIVNVHLRTSTVTIPYPFITFKSIQFDHGKEIINTPILTSNTVVLLRVYCYGIF